MEVASFFLAAAAASAAATALGHSERVKLAAKDI